MYTLQEVVNEVVALRHELHAHPEASGEEEKTREILKAFLRKYTSLTLVEHPRWFYAVHREEGATETIALRADHDAIISEDGRPFHGCGHDGHSAILAGTAMYLEGREVGNNIVFLFQHAEENGAGAKECVALFREVEVDRIYGLHNIPGLPLHHLCTKPGALQCASTGVIIEVEGRQSHASEPEKGSNPIYPLSTLVKELEVFSEFRGFGPMEACGLSFKGLVLATVVSLRLGEEGAFGVSPSRSRLELTVRALYDEDLEKLLQWIRKELETLVDKETMHCQMSFSDTFPETVNDEAITAHWFKVMEEAGLETMQLQDPVRASEDFGTYLKEKPGCYFYLGAGDSAPVHTLEYTFVDEIIPTGIKAFEALMKSHRD